MELGAVSGGYKALQCPGTGPYRPPQGVRVPRSTVWVSGWVDPNPKELGVRCVSDTVVTYILRRSFLNISKQRNSWQS